MTGRWERERADRIRASVSPRAPQGRRHAAAGRAAVLDAIAERHTRETGALRTSRHLELPDRRTLRHRLDEILRADKNKGTEGEIEVLVLAIALLAAIAAAVAVALDAIVWLLHVLSG